MSDQVNLTEAMNKACESLNRMVTFNGLEVLEAKTETLETKLSIAKEDNLNAEDTNKYINNYALATIHLDVYELGSGSPYVDVIVRNDKIESDLREFLLNFVKDPKVLPQDIRFDGSEMEIIRE